MRAALTDVKWDDSRMTVGATVLRDAGRLLFTCASRILLGLSLALSAGCGGGSSGPAAPSALSYESPQMYPVGTAITPLNPSVTGTVSSYSASPALPAGLTIDTNSGRITGTPSAPAAAADYTITVENSAGSTSFGLSIAVIAVNATPASISRMVASGTPVTVALSAASVNFAFSGTLSAKAADAGGVFLPAVTVTPNNGGYALELTTSKTVAPGHYASQVTIRLCSDSSCASAQAVPSISVPFDIDVLSSNSAWPGNNLSALSPWSGANDWTMFQGNAAHTGYVPVDVDPNQFSTRWQVPAVAIGNDFYYPNLATVATANGQLFIAGGTTLYARNESDGSEAWQYDFGGLAFPSVNPPSVANGVVYVAAGQQTSTFMFAFKAADGTPVFKSPMSSQWEHYLAPTIGSHGVYTNAGEFGGIFGFDPSGTQLFFDGLAQTSVWTPAADADWVYTYTGDSLKVIDPVSGAIHSSIADPTFTNYVYEIAGSAVLGAPGSVFAANYANSALDGGDIGNTLLDFNLNLNSIEWQIPGVYPTTPAYNAGVLYVANNKPLRLEARAETDGALLWSWTPPQAGEVGFVSEVLLTKTLAFVSTNLAVYGIDISSHQTVWSYPLVGRLALSQNGILYIEGAAPLTAINLK